MQTLKKLLDLLNQDERKRASLLLVMIMVMAFLDMLGVASIMPFLAVLGNPQLVENNDLLNTAYRYLNFRDTQTFLLAFGLLVFALLVSSLAFKALTNFTLLRFALMREFSIGKRLVEGYLHQPYSWFLSRNSADIGKTILSEVSTVVSNALLPIINLIAHGTVAIALLMLVTFIDPMVALTLGAMLGLSYGLIFKATSGFLGRIGKERVKANQARFTAVSEAFGAAKEVKVGGLEQAFIRRFAQPAQTYARHQASAMIINQLPRFALEAVAFGGMLLVVLYLMTQSGSFTTVVPIISLYAFAGYRLMPALQQIYGALTQLRFSGPALEAVHKDVMSLQSALSEIHQNVITLNESIKLNNITYSYTNANKPALKGMSLTIPAKTTVGLVGTSGSGKTTTVDIILCLLEAREGTLEIDGEVITERNRRAWQSSIGYVPQQIYLADATVAANIAYGVAPEHINSDAVVRAARIANLHDFVTNDLDQGYNTIVGERGVRLSGGQRQRIGIARALYNNPQVLILDEATSALDNLTEQAVMDAVHNLSHDITIILVAHRLSTVKDCDQIFLLEKGELKGQGRFNELTKANRQFRAMTQV